MRRTLRQTSPQAWPQVQAKEFFSCIKLVVEGADAERRSAPSAFRHSLAPTKGGEKSGGEEVTRGGKNSHKILPGNRGIFPEAPRACRTSSSPYPRHSENAPHHGGVFQHNSTRPFIRALARAHNPGSFQQASQHRLSSLDKRFLVEFQGAARLLASLFFFIKTPRRLPFRVKKSRKNIFS